MDGKTTTRVLRLGLEPGIKPSCERSKQGVVLDTVPSDCGDVTEQKKKPSDTGDPLLEIEWIDPPKHYDKVKLASLLLNVGRVAKEMLSQKEDVPLVPARRKRDRQHVA